MVKTKLNDENLFEIVPDEDKCFKSKLNGHKFIHTNGVEGLPLYLNEEELTKYEEVLIEENE